ncbi:hypothetical protein TSAR_001276 [Trichomalopsis sarcophagae]|uniref:C2H2-type domain-containing protein n=1 Tax=Trichomalopsis sarcophagae TaxID=543379 RepID=A0A232EXB4_9HYME|nr:hypothetical protein TSAR_001276 [Trichomalopsis sarcophagae]
MSAENAQPLDKTTYMHEEYTLLQDLEEYQEDILGGLSVLVNDNNLDNTQVQQLVLNDELLKTLTAVTLPDGTQAFVAENPSPNELETEEPALRLENGAIFLRDASELNNGKVIQLQLDSLGSECPKNSIGESSDGEVTYPQLQVIDGVLYVVTNQIEESQDVWEVSEETPKLDTIFSTNNQNEEEKPKSKHECPREDCTKVYSTVRHLKVHERTHTGQRPYLCTHPKCKKSFSTGYSLKAHLRTHTGEKPYKCTTEECDKSFKTSGDLLKHVRTHTGERPFVCPFEGCGRSFTTSNIRKVHIRTHTGERPFKCPQPKCGKAFASSTNYKNHIRIHSGEKPYVCSINNCGRRFTEYSSLYKHHIVHTQEKPFECEVCHRQYRQQSTLLMHKKTAHSIIDTDNENDNDDHDEVLDVLLENSVDMIDQANELAYVETGQVEVTDCVPEDETQILLVEDPSQLVTLQAMESLTEEPEDIPIDIALEEFNIKYEDVAFRWN